MYKILNNFNVPITIFKSENKKVNGINTKVYTEIGAIFGSFKAYGGTEKESNDLIIIENTAVVETYFRPDITNDCKLKLNDESEWEIIHLENIDMKNMYLKLKVRSIKGKA